MLWTLYRADASNLFSTFLSGHLLSGRSLARAMEVFKRRNIKVEGLSFVAGLHRCFEVESRLTSFFRNGGGGYGMEVGVNDLSR